MHLPPDPFFAGEGLDRADPLRADPSAIVALHSHSEALQLVWVDGAPGVDQDGKLLWAQIEGSPPLVLGLSNGAPRFSELPDGSAPATAYAHFQLLSLLDPQEAPTFAAALSLANWHRRHRHCSVCGQMSEPNRGGWSR